MIFSIQKNWRAFGMMKQPLGKQKRWNPVEKFNDHKGKILDMSCGSGIFVFSGLAKGYDIYGVDPDAWKHTYYNMKIDEQALPNEWKNRFIKGYGENLPFNDSFFDYIESAQTLEHTNDYKKCLNELIRVLKPGGKLRIFAPDYSGIFFEPHYRLPFLPNMNRNLAKIYLKLLNKPTIGLDTITYTTSNRVLEYLNEKHLNIKTIDLYKLHKERKANAFNKKHKLGTLISRLVINTIYYNIFKTKGIKPINLVIIKKQTSHQIKP